MTDDIQTIRDFIEGTIKPGDTLHDRHPAYVVLAALDRVADKNRRFVALADALKPMIYSSGDIQGHYVASGHNALLAKVKAVMKGEEK